MITSDIGIRRKEYFKLNESFKKKLVFHLGAEAGFFSEYNNMIFAMLYCLQHEIKFILYSKNANFGYINGWTDYFESFCEEDTNEYHSIFNKRRPYSYIKKGEGWKIQFYKRIIVPLNKQKGRLTEYVVKKIHFKKAGNFAFTYELWEAFHNQPTETSVFNFPSLKINGNLRSASGSMSELTWVYKSEVKKEIEAIVAALNLPPEYLGFHIRGGDKFIEYELHEVHTYINRAIKLSDCRQAFVLTDDYRIIEQLSYHFPEWKFFTLCDKSSKGYFHSDFVKKNKDHIRDQHIKLFASTDILKQAKFFIGTFNSNVGAYLGVRMDHEKCFGVDFENWRIF